MAVTAEYLPTASPFRNPSDYTPELSRRARGVEVWAALHSLGREGVTALVKRNCAHARRFAEGVHFLVEAKQRHLPVSRLLDTPLLCPYD